MSELKFTVGKKYRTRGGEIVECIAVWSKPNKHNRQVTVLRNTNETYTVTTQGISASEGLPVEEDIVEQLPDVKTVEGYVTVFADGSVGSLFYATEEECQEYVEKFKVKIVKVSGTYEVTE